MLKKIFPTLLTILILAFAALPAFSEGWVYGQFNTWYEKADGSRLSNGKYTIDGEDYIFDFEGNRVFNKWTILTDGEWYYSLSDGKVAKNQWINNTFYVDEYGVKVRDRWYNGNYFDIDGFLTDAQPEPAPAPVQFSLTGNSAFYEIEAENFDTGSGVMKADEGGGCLGYIENGDHAAYYGLDFGDGAYSFIANVSSIHEGGIIELHLNALNGPEIGYCSVSGTESWEAWRDFKCDIEPISGVHDLFLVFRGPSGYLFNLNYFRFTGMDVRVTKTAYRDFSAARFNDFFGVFGENNGGNIGYIEDYDWVMYSEVDFGEGADSASVSASSLLDGGTVEFRLDSIDGNLIGACKVSNTGSWSDYRDFRCGISNAKGIHDLYLVFHGGSGYLFNIRSFRFEK